MFIKHQFELVKNYIKNLLSYLEQDSKLKYQLGF